MADCTLRLWLDASRAMADLGLLAQSAQGSLQLRQRLLDLGDLAGELRAIHLERLPTAGAGECRVGLELSDRLAELVRAVRAGQFDAL